MANLGERVWKRVQSTLRAFRSDCAFSMKFALMRVLDELGGRVGLEKISEWAHEKKDLWIQRYLEQNISSVLAKYENNEDRGFFSPDAPIWVCWWSGLETAPELVKRCVESIYCKAGNHPVHLITEATYRNYLEIPVFMQEKVTAGKMGLAHLADYIRVTLLADYGGMWLDATIFCSEQIPEGYFDMPIFTCKGPVRKSNYISDYRWTTFCLGGWKGNVFYHALSEALAEYWQKNDYAVDYLFFDHIILSLYMHAPAVRKLLDDIPDNNIRRDDLQAAMNAALPAEAFDEIVHADTVIYKLSWRETYAEQTPGGQDTIYARFICTDKRADK